MGWVICYVVVGLLVAVIVSVLADRSSTRPGSAILMSALIWPVIIIGAAQMGLWTLIAEVLRTAAETSGDAAMVRLNAPPL